MINSFPPNSRYHGIPVKTFKSDTGEEIAYLSRRFVPPPERFALLQKHTIKEGDRLDLLAARYIGDPERYWQLCDANGVIRPAELIENPGRSIRITLPEGIPGAADA